MLSLTSTGSSLNFALIQLNHMVPEEDPGQKKNTIQVSYLSEIVSTSRFGICKNEIIS